MSAISRKSHCKINLILNILGKRPDGFHELETIMQPIRLCDRLEFARAAAGIHLTCSRPDLPVGPENLVHRAASVFFDATRIKEGVKIRLEKHIPLAAGLGGGSGNAAETLLGLNELFGQPLAAPQLPALAAQLGSDVPFFLQSQPALAVGRGEQIEALPAFPALQGACAILVHPGFGVSTAWAYKALAHYPEALQGRAGRARELLHDLQHASLEVAGKGFYNSLETPVVNKYPLLLVFQEFLRQHGATVTMMSGSGSTTFALVPSPVVASQLLEKFKAHFGDVYWTAQVNL
jgi:4-diphosphocytidyl-2-C-methyl-D-erythritol kinase